MRQVLAILLLNSLFSICLAQENNFYISNTYFSGEQIKYFSENRGGAVVVLQNGGIYLMNRNQEFTEVSQLFSGDILSDITCVESVDENFFYLGTENHSLFAYQSGEIINLKQNNPELPDRINSIDLKTNKFETKLILATNDNIWASKDFKNFSKRPLTYTNETRFFGGRESILLTDYPYCENVPGNYGIQYQYFSGTVLFRMFEDSLFTLETLNDIAYTGTRNGTFYTNAYYGTDRGLYSHRIRSCGTDTAVHFQDLRVNDLLLISNQLPISTLFVASDSGLYFSENPNPTDPTYHLLEGIEKVYTVDYSRFHNKVWLGTNEGLKVLEEDDFAQESLRPEIPEFTSLKLCREDGLFLYSNLNDQLDIQWYRDGVKIMDAISTNHFTQEEGLYSVSYTFEDSTYFVDIAEVTLDTDLPGRISIVDNTICPNENSAIIEIANFEFYKHSYSWYSEENGLEFEAGTGTRSFSARKAGNYYFIATNCNGLTYKSQTVVVNESELEEPFFPDSLKNTNFCIDDTLWVQGAANAVEYTWNYEFTSNNPYYLLDEINNSSQGVYVTAKDEYGCSLSTSTDIGSVLEQPYLPATDFYRYICEPQDFVTFNLPYGSFARWEGYQNGESQKVGPGVYSVEISNDVCPVYETNVQIEYFDPYPTLNIDDTTLFVGEKLEIALSDDFILNWSSIFQRNNNTIYALSTIPDSIRAQIFTIATDDQYKGIHDCSKVYEFDIIFVEAPPLSLTNNGISINIYPNPVNNTANIEVNHKEIYMAELYNLQGQLVQSSKFEAAKAVKMRVSDYLPSGTYILKITTNDFDELVRKVFLIKE